MKKAKHAAAKRPSVHRDVISATTSARRYDGAMRLEFVFQPQDARKLFDQLVTVLVSSRREPPQS